MNFVIGFEIGFKINNVVNYKTNLQATKVSVVAKIPRKNFSGTALAASDPSVIPGTEPSNNEPSNSQLIEPNHQCPIAAIAVSGTA